MASGGKGASGAAGAVTVHTMGVHYRWDIPPIIETQLRLAHQAREDLVALELAYGEDVKAIWSSYPGVAQAEAELQAAESAHAALAEQAKVQRAERASRRTDLQLQLREAKQRLGQARQARRDEITTVRDESSEQRGRRLKQLRADQKALYGKYAELGLYWATFNDIAAHHKMLVQRINKARSEGRPSQLRHQRFDGTGTLTVQIQRRDAAPIRTPSTLANARGRYAYFAVVPWIAPERWQAMTRPEQRAAGRGTVRMRVGTSDGEPQWVEIPVQAHRWLPAGADITHVRLTVKRTAARRRAQVLLSARISQPQAVADQHAAAVVVHLGWRQTESGVRVASWRSTRPLSLPAGLGRVIVSDGDGLTGQILIPPTIMNRLDHSERLGAERSKALGSMRAALSAWLDQHGPIQHQGRDLAAADVSQWRSPAPFAALAKAWREASPPLSDIGNVLETWRKVDAPLWDRQEHGRRRALGFRDDLYRQVAAAIVTQARLVVVDDMDLSAVARMARSQDDRSGALLRSAERRHRAAPGRLREAIVRATRRAGVCCESVSPKGLARIHADCGHENPVDDRYATPVVTCDGCGKRYVTESSTTLLMLRQAGVVL